MRLAFDLVRQSAGGNPAVLRRLLRALALAASQVRDPTRLPVLRQQVLLLLEVAQVSLPTAYARQEVQAVYAELCAPWMGEASAAGALPLG